MFLYMFRGLSVHLQEDTIVYMQHMVLSLSTRVRGGLSVRSLSEISHSSESSHSSCVPTGHQELSLESDSTKCCMYTIVSS